MDRIRRLTVTTVARSPVTWQGSRLLTVQHGDRRRGRSRVNWQSPLCLPGQAQCERNASRVLTSPDSPMPATLKPCRAVKALIHLPRSTKEAVPRTVKCMASTWRGPVSGTSAASCEYNMNMCRAMVAGTMTVSRGALSRASLGGVHCMLAKGRTSQAQGPAKGSRAWAGLRPVTLVTGRRRRGLRKIYLNKPG